MPRKKKNLYRLDRPLLVDEKDDRYKKYCKSIEKTGISPDELWNMDVTLAHFLLPRIKEFRKIAIGIPGGLNNLEEWHEIIDKMIVAFEIIADEDEYYATNPSRTKELVEGLDAFHSWFRCVHSFQERI